MDLLKKLTTFVIFFIGLSANSVLASDDQRDGISTDEAEVATAESNADTDPETEPSEATTNEPNSEQAVHSLQPAQPPAKPLKPLQLQESIKAHGNTDLPQDI